MSEADNNLSADTAPSPCCNAAWNEDGDEAHCARCGLTRSDITALMAPGFAAYERARVAALAGDWTTARRHLADARAAGLSFDLADGAPSRLSALCAAASGDWAALLASDQAALDLLPSAVQAVVADPARVAVIAADNERARRFAAHGNLDTARVFADECAHAAPFWAGAHELQSLCATGARLQAESAPVAPVALQDVVAAGDATDGPVGVPSGVRPAQRQPRAGRQARRAAVASRRAAALAVKGGPTATGPRRQPTRAASRTPFTLTLPRLLPLIAATLSLAACTAAAVALRASATPRAADAAIAPPTAQKDIKAQEKLPAAKSPASSFILHPSSFPPSEEEARRLFNLAVAAKRAGLWGEAARLSEAAHARARGTYIEDESLLLWAQASDNTHNETDATVAARYRRIADETPRSRYAPLALREAARVAKRAGRAGEAARDLARLQADYGDR